jgi:TRAP-type mannitol/chloroaromatic compound transport system permease large subunit
MGLISLPVMLRNNYSKSLATGTISASGTLGQIIPPSIVLIILADQLSNATDQASTLRLAEYKQATGSISMPSEFGLTSTSAGDMFLGALLPGMVLVGLYMVYILVLALLRPRTAPPVSFDGDFDMKFAIRVFLALVPPLTLIFAVLGSIILGIATVNQAGAIGAIGAMIMAGYRLVDGKRGAYSPAILAIASVAALAVLLSIFDINIKNVTSGTEWLAVGLAGIAVVAFLIAIFWSAWRAYTIDDTLRGVMIETAKTTSLVFIILLGAAMLTAAFRAFGGEELVRDFLTGLPGGFITKFIVVMAVIFVLGFFLDFIEIAVVVVPIIAPILLADTSANVTAVWLGVMIGVNMQTSFLTPPFGFALFYLRGVAPPEVRTIQMYAGVVPFITLQLVGLAIVGIFPSLVNYLPNRVYLTSETAPPPKNPRLQHCVEGYLFQQFDNRADEIRASVAKAKGLDISYLPDRRQRALKESFAAAEGTFGLIDKVRIAERAVQAAEPEYRPLHRQVRRIQVRIHDVKSDLEQEKTEFERLREGEATEDERRARTDHIAELEAALRDLESLIPAGWADAEKRFRVLSTAERRARLAYRRNVDEAYEPIVELRRLIAGAEDLAKLQGDLMALSSLVSRGPTDDVIKTFKAAESALGRIPGTSHIKSRFSRVRREMGRRSPKPDKIAKDLAEGMKRYRAEVSWRRRAHAELAGGLEAYDLAISDTIGLRSQDRLSSEQADEIAVCQSVHRDISLSF